MSPSCLTLDSSGAADAAGDEVRAYATLFGGRLKRGESNLSAIKTAAEMSRAIPAAAIADAKKSVDIASGQLRGAAG